MQERPILFSGPLVRSILSGAKTQTRRVVKPPGKRWPNATLANATIGATGDYLCVPDGSGVVIIPSPFKVGDRLYVRERARVLATNDSIGRMRVRYEADGVEAGVPWPERIKRPRIGDCLANGAYLEACRTWLEVTSVRVERLQDISEEDARAEGWPGPRADIDDPEVHRDAARDWFMDLWDSLAPEGSRWDDDPFVWSIAFKRLP